MSLQFRAARREDIPAILALYAPFIQNTTVTFEYEVPSLADFSARFERITERFPWLVCFDGDTLAGYAYASPAFERAAFSWDADLSVYVSPDYHHRGIASELYRRIEGELLRRGYHNLYALITGENLGSCRFHELLGYELIATLPKTGYKHGKWLDLYWYAKRLRGADEHPTEFPLQSTK
jgi:phosphinothricin acetyltransferase